MTLIGALVCGLWSSVNSFVASSIACIGSPVCCLQATVQEWVGLGQAGSTIKIRLQKKTAWLLDCSAATDVRMFGKMNSTVMCRVLLVYAPYLPVFCCCSSFWFVHFVPLYATSISFGFVC